MDSFVPFRWVCLSATVTPYLPILLHLLVYISLHFLVYDVKPSSLWFSSLTVSFHLQSLHSSPCIVFFSPFYKSIKNLSLALARLNIIFCISYLSSFW